MKLRLPAVVFLFVLGAAAGLAGDHGHVVTGTTEYFPDAHRVPFVWSSPIWFPILVGVTTVALAELRLRLPAPRTTVTVRDGVGGVAAVLGIYAVTALMNDAPTGPTTVLICALAAITWCVLGDRYSIVCGIAVAVLGPTVEALMSLGGLFRYTPGSDTLFGVGLWLPALYFAFGVVGALLGEIAATKQNRGGRVQKNQRVPTPDRGR